MRVGIEFNQQLYSNLRLRNKTGDWVNFHTFLNRSRLFGQKVYSPVSFTMAKPQLKVLEFITKRRDSPEEELIAFNTEHMVVLFESNLHSYDMNYLVKKYKI